MVAFARRVQSELLEKVPHIQYVVTIPKMLRLYFKHHRKLLGLLSRSFYETLKEFSQITQATVDLLLSSSISICGICPNARGRGKTLQAISSMMPISSVDWPAEAGFPALA